MMVTTMTIRGKDNVLVLDTPAGRVEILLDFNEVPSTEQVPGRFRRVRARIRAPREVRIEKRTSADPGTTSSAVA